MPEEKEERAVARRLRGKTRRPAAIVKLHRCLHCERSYAHRGNLVTHIRQVHSGTYERPKCEHRGLTFCDATNLALHIIRRHEETPRIYKCPRRGCKKTFKTKRNLRQHRNMVHTHHARVFKCPHCEYAATSRFTLQAHIANIHPDPGGYPCPHCGL